MKWIRRRSPLMLEAVFALALGFFLTLLPLLCPAGRAQTDWIYDPDLRPITRPEIVRIIQNRKTTPTVHQSLLARASASRQLEYAVEQYDKIRKVRPDEPVLQSAFGYAFFIESDPFYKPTNEILWKRQREKLFPEALSAVQRGITGKGNTIAFCWRALAAASIGQHTGYVADGLLKAEKARTLDPKDAYTYRLLAKGYSIKGAIYDADKALQMAKQATVYKPNMATAYFYQAAAYREKKQHQEAFRCIQKCYSLMPPDLHSSPQAVNVLKMYRASAKQ